MKQKSDIQNKHRYFFPRIFLQNFLPRDMVMLKVDVNSESHYIFMEEKFTWSY